jgi:hypothetical protein
VEGGVARGERPVRVGTREGGQFDASFSIWSTRPLTIFYEQSGGGRERATNTDYSRGLIEMLRRLGELDALLLEIRVESATVASLTLEQRRVQLRNHTLPLRLASVLPNGCGRLKSDVSVGARNPGRRPGSSTGGSSRNLLLVLADLPMGADELAQVLAEPRGR